MDVRLLPVLSLFLFLAVVVRMSQRAVVVLMCVPVRTVFPLADRSTTMVMRDVVVVVAVASRLMTVLASLSLALRVLLSWFYRGSEATGWN